SSRRRHTRFSRDWSSDVCSSDLVDDRRSWEERHRILTVAVYCEVPPCASVEVSIFLVGPRSEEEFVEVGSGSGRVQAAHFLGVRSEERRVGKGCSVWSVRLERSI